MRIVKAEFRRLLGFRDVSVKVDPKLQLIAGPNNAGKSTMVRLMEVFFSDPSTEYFRELRPLNEYYATEGPRALSEVTVHFGQLSNEEERVFESALRRRDGTFSISLRFSRRGKVSHVASRNPGRDEAQRLYREVLARFHFVKIPSIRIAEEGLSGAESLERLLETFEAVLIRKGNARSTSLQQRFSDLLAPVEEMVGDVLNESAEAIKDELPFRENQVSFRLSDSSHALRGMLSAAVIESQGDVAIPVSQRGTGFQSALVLGILRFVANREAQAGGSIFFAIEEPEAFLHPQTQRAMAKIIRGISDKAQVLVTTHSSVLVDSFEVSQIARLPLQSGGLVHLWAPPRLEVPDAGRLTRWCSATNSELVFANAAIFVEGEGDFKVVEKILEKICGAPGGHYAIGLTVIETGGVSNMRYLIELAELFNVRSYVLADRDTLHKRNGSRALLDVLKARHSGPDGTALNSLREESDKTSADLRSALARQSALNSMLAPFDAFVLAADLEGLLLDMYGFVGLVDALGPEGLREIDAPFVSKLLNAEDGRSDLASWLGSKGWNSKGNPTGKLKPHVPAMLIERWLRDGEPNGEVLDPLVGWLSEIVEDASPAPL